MAPSGSGDDRTGRVWRFADLPRPPGAVAASWGGILDPGLHFLHPVPAAAAAYWRSRCPPGGGLPGRQDIDPLAMRGFLPHLMLQEITWRGDAPPRLRYRLLGTALVDHYGELTGRWLDEVLAPNLLSANEFLATEVARRRAPLRNLERAGMRRRDWIIIEGVGMPLASNHVDVDMLMVALVTWPEEEPPPEVVAACAALR